jgi:hypothetical protein
VRKNQQLREIINKVTCQTLSDFKRTGVKKITVTPLHNTTAANETGHVAHEIGPPSGSGCIFPCLFYLFWFNWHIFSVMSTSMKGLKQLFGTAYHDAHSSVPGTPLLPPLPRNPVPAAPLGDQAVAEVLSQTNPPSGLPAHNDEDTTSSLGLTDNLNLRLNFVPGSDILDMPAPVALHHFVSISSLKDATTGSSSLALKTPAFPPGLDTVRPVGWSDVAMEVTDSSP